MLLNFAEMLLDGAEMLPEFLEISRNSIEFANVHEFYGVPDKTQTRTQTQNREEPGCPPPSWRCGFGGRKRTLPWRGGREKRE